MRRLHIAPEYHHLPKLPLQGQRAPIRELKRVGDLRGCNLSTQGASIGLQEGCTAYGSGRKSIKEGAVAEDRARGSGRRARGPGCVLNLNLGRRVRLGRILKTGPQVVSNDQFSEATDMTSVLQTLQLQGGGLGHEKHTAGRPPPDPEPPSTIGPRASVSLIGGNGAAHAPRCTHLGTLHWAEEQRAREHARCRFQWMDGTGHTGFTSTRQEASLFTMSAGGSTDTKARCSLERQSRPVGTPAPSGAEKANNNRLDVLLIFGSGGVYKETFLHFAFFFLFVVCSEADSSYSLLIP